MEIRKKAQQEMVGFIVIVVLVIIIGLIFLIISLNKQDEVKSNIEIDNMIDVIFAVKTSCSIGYEQNYASIKDLVKDAYSSKRCVSGKDAYDVLEQELESIMANITSTETGFSSYELKIIERDEQEQLFLELGNNASCVSGISGGQRVISGGGVDLVVRVRVC